MSARTSLAPGPTNNGNPDPASFAPRAGSRRPSRRVEEAEPLPNLPVRLPARGRGRAPAAHHPVARRVAVGQLGQRQVGNEQGLRVDPGLDVPHFRFESVDLRAELLASLDDLGRQRAALFHHAGIGPGRLVAVGFELVEPSGERAAAHVEGFELVEQRCETGVAATRERRPHLARGGAQQLDVDHGATARESPA